MVDFAQRNAERAGVADAVQLRGGDALQRMPPGETPGVMLVNPPYGERIEAAGVAGRSQGGREQRADRRRRRFFTQLAAHWKKNYAGWTAWVLTPDLKLPSRMRLKESRRVPMWNGPIECRLFRFDMVAGSARGRRCSPLVLDTNIVLDLFVFDDAAAQAAEGCAGARRCGWVATQAMRDELERVLDYPHIVPRLALYAAGGRATCWRASIATRALVEAPAKARVTCSDPDDQKFIDLAVQHQCLLLSKDAAVLTMKSASRLSKSVCCAHCRLPGESNPLIAGCLPRNLRRLAAACPRTLLRITGVQPSSTPGAPRAWRDQRQKSKLSLWRTILAGQVELEPGIDSCCPTMRPVALKQVVRHPNARCRCRHRL